MCNFPPISVIEGGQYKKMPYFQTFPDFEKKQKPVETFNVIFKNTLL